MISARHLGKKTALWVIAFALGANTAAFAGPAVNIARRFTVLYQFSDPYGSAPAGKLDLAIGFGSTRTLYGETEGGGAGESGTIFSYTLASSVFSSLYQFTGGNDGGEPLAGLAHNDTDYFPAGRFQLGVTISGGAAAQGVVFAVAPNGTTKIVHTFTGGSDGGAPSGRLTLFRDGNYYGTTTSGALGYGTVYRITPAGQFSTIYAFSGGADGGSPQAGLALSVNLGERALAAVGDTASAIVERIAATSPQYVAPYLYGTTSTAGANGVGTIFRISPAGYLETLYSFTDGLDGGVPVARLTSDLQGDLFGSTTVGGSAGNGVIFELSRRSTTPRVIHDFGDGTTGAEPVAELTYGLNRVLYGTASQGGAGGQGDVFQITITPFGGFSDIHDFGGADGSDPEGALVDGGDHKLYGTTINGGANDQGVLFSIRE
jgi:uncharacterized repeat protein (TIGR03803 family)